MKLLLWYAEMGRNLLRFDAAAEDMRVGRISGAVGAFGNHPKIRLHKGFYGCPYISYIAPTSHRELTAASKYGKIFRPNRINDLVLDYLFEI